MPYCEGMVITCITMHHPSPVFVQLFRPVISPWQSSPGEGTADCDLFSFKISFIPFSKLIDGRCPKHNPARGYKTQVGNVTHFTSLDVQYGSMAGC